MNETNSYERFFKGYIYGVLNILLHIIKNMVNCV